MSVVVTVLHVIVCLFLIVVVLLQRGRGAQVGAAFGGGGGATMFGARGAGNFLTKLTTGAAVVFMFTSLSLAYMRMHRGERLFEGGAVEEEQAQKPAAAPFEEIPQAPGQAPAEQAAPPAGEAPAPAPNPAP
jgi:preprotein translocase subunit SecG